MRLDRYSPRRAVLQALASVVLVPTSAFSFEPPQNDDEPDNASDEKTKPAGETGKVTDEEAASKGAVKRSDTVALTVVVTGNGRPIALAEVTVTFPPGAGHEMTLRTDPKGEATFRSARAGKGKVRVLVAGWESFLQEVTFKHEPQQLTIRLNPLQ